MTYQDAQKYAAIQSEVIEYLKEQGYNTFFNDYEMLKDLVETAKRLNKTNNSLLQYEDYEGVVMYISAKDLKTNEVVTKQLTAKKENTTKQIFIYQVLKSQHATLDMYEHFKN